MNFDASLVIHAGDLIPVSEAWLKMNEEFLPHGYTEERLKFILERAHAATQAMLRAIASLPEEDQKIRLEWALRSDRQAAANWRSQWRTGSKQYEDRQYSSIESHQERLARYRRDQEEQEKLRKEWEAGAPERERKAEEQRELRKAKILAQAKAKYQKQFEAWTEQNERGSWKEFAYERARQRAQEDLDRSNARWRRTVEASYRHTEARLNRLSDHDYLEWMFDCYGHELVAPT